MKWKMLISIIMLLNLCLLFSHLVYAYDWTLKKMEGNWDIQGRMEFKSGWDDDWCYLEFSVNVSNFAGWILTIDSEIYQDWWWVFTESTIYLEVGNPNTDTYFGVKLTNSINQGLYFSLKGSGIAFWNNETWESSKFSYVNVDWNVKIFRSNVSELTFQVEGFVDANNYPMTVEKKFNVNVSFFENVTLFFVVFEQTSSISFQNGQIYGKIINEEIITGIPNLYFPLKSESDWWTYIKTVIWETLRGSFKPVEPVASFLGQLWNFLSYAGAFLGKMFYQVSAFIPLIIQIFGIWFFIFILENLMDFNIKPITEMSIMIYQFFANLISMFVNVAQTIYEYIKFWWWKMKGLFGGIYWLWFLWQIISILIIIGLILAIIYYTFIRGD